VKRHLSVLSFEGGREAHNTKEGTEGIAVTQGKNGRLISLKVDPEVGERGNLHNTTIHPGEGQACNGSHLSKHM